MSNITVFASSSHYCPKNFLDSAYELGQILGTNKHHVIYGGGCRGLMGKLTDGVLSVGGHIEGIIPEFMVSMGWENSTSSELKIVSTMHERIDYMLQKADVIITLPGGIGTLEELMQALSWKYLGLIIPKIYILNQDGFFDRLLAHLDFIYEQKFMGAEPVQLYTTMNSLEELTNQL